MRASLESQSLVFTDLLRRIALLGGSGESRRWRSRSGPDIGRTGDWKVRFLI